jgi:hypothetical protein
LRPAAEGTAASPAEPISSGCASPFRVVISHRRTGGAENDAADRHSPDRKLDSLGFRFGDSFALPLKHQFTLEAGDSADDGEHQVTGRLARIFADIFAPAIGPENIVAGALGVGLGDIDRVPMPTLYRNAVQTLPQRVCSG